MNTIKTVVRAYCFNVLRSPEDKAAYEALRTELKGKGLECFVSHGGGGSHYLPKLDGVAVELETSTLFSNQWNTAPIPGVSENGYRVFDWAEDFESAIGAPAGVKRGHYLEQVPEMGEVRRNTHKCGYCGTQEPAAKGYVFCPHCIGSEYLTVATLNLTRMIPVQDDWKKNARPELTEAESAHLLPLFKAAQIHGHSERDKTRIANKKAALVKARDKAIKKANTEHDGMMWFLERGINTDNVIYYDHKNIFSWGWRSPVDDVLKDAILAVISEFPFDYEIKCADGKTLGRKG